jgi:hypothetical protein
MTGLVSDNIWRHCNICKTGIGFQAGYFVCSVSTCNRKRTGLTFCSLACFEAHLPTARHRDAWAEQETSPSRTEWEAARSENEEAAADAAEERERTRPGAAAASPARAAEPETTSDVLVVVSKLKKYVRDWSGMNTSDTAISVLSDHLRELCREAIRQAGLDGRRTVLDRDFTKVLKQRREDQREGGI